MKAALSILYAAGWLVSYTYPLLLILSESGTCTQGATDEYAASSFLCAVMLSLFIPAVHVLHNKAGRLWWLCLFHPISVIAYSFIVPKYLYHTTARGYSLCYGNEFRGSFSDLPASGYETAGAEDRLYALVFTAALGVIIYYSAKTVSSRFRRTM